MDTFTAENTERLVFFSCSVVSDSLWPHGLQQAGLLSFTISQNLLKLMPIESVMPSNYLILCHPLLLLPSIFPNIRVFSSESALRIRWPKYQSFEYSPHVTFLLPLLQFPHFPQFQQRALAKGIILNPPSSLTMVALASGFLSPFSPSFSSSSHSGVKCLKHHLSEGSAWTILSKRAPCPCHPGSLAHFVC